MVELDPVPFAQPLRPLRPERLPQPAHEGRWIVFEYCISLVAVTLRRTSRPVFVRADERAWLHGMPYSCISFLFGWWGLPWGVIYTPVTIFSNFTGGCDITAQVREAACARE
jgi:hypothetical protein